MDTVFSSRIRGLAPSAIREILKVTQNPEVISFAAGSPAPEAFPVEELSEISARLFAENPASLLQYGISEGCEPLRVASARRLLERYGAVRDFDDTIIVSGGQQGIELAAKIFLNEGDTVICEDPSFIGALNAFRSFGAALAGVPLEHDGPDLSRLEERLKTDRRVRLIYVIPTFQNPSGITMSLEKRRALLDLAEKYDVYIIEDSPYFELRYAGRDIPPIKSLDETGRVIFVGSYSKTVAPGLRIGYVIARRDIIAKLTVAKQVSDVHTNLFFSRAVAEFVTKYAYDAHIKKICGLYAPKLELMHSLAKSLFPEEVRFEKPEGGLFMWFTLPGPCDSAGLCRAAAEKLVAAVPGAGFACGSGEACPSFRLNFSLPSREQIEKGMGILADALRDFLKK